MALSTLQFDGNAGAKWVGKRVRVEGSYNLTNAAGVGPRETIEDPRVREELLRIDTPAWPSGASAAKVGFAVQSKGAQRTVEVRVAVGDVVRSFRLPADQGTLSSAAQSFCSHKNDKDVVATLVMRQGGTGKTLLRKKGDVLEVVAWSQMDGACPGKDGLPEECPPEQTVLATIPVPMGLSFEETLVVADASGAERVADCSKGNL